MVQTMTALVALAATLAYVSASVEVQGVSKYRVVTCNDAVEIDPPPTPSPTYERVVFNRLAIANEQFPDSVGRTSQGPFRYWAKSGILVRPRRTPVDLIVPTAWRGRLAIEWGNGGLSYHLRFVGCRSVLDWLPYAGGFFLRKPACVPLIVRVGKRSTRLRFGIGKPC
jgi:hypothetical protein